MRRIQFLFRSLLLLALLGLPGLPGPRALAQTTPTLGFDPYSTFHAGGADSVNLKNGNSVIKIPLFTLPQLGAFKAITYSLVANTSVWMASPACGSPSACVYSIVTPPGSTMGPVLQPDLPASLASGTAGYGYNGGYYSVVDLPSLTDSSGANHPLVFNYSDLTELRSVDGSGYRVKYPTGTQAYNPVNGASTGPGIVSMPNGIHGVFSGSSFSHWVDLDGNTMSETTDTIGRTVNGVDSYTAGTGTVSEHCPNLGISGQTAASYAIWTPVIPAGSSTPDPRFTYTICYTQIYYHTNFWPDDEDGAGYVLPYEYHGDDGDEGGTGGYTTFAEGFGGDYVIQSVTLPDGTYWGFGYDSGTYNPTLGTITLSTGLINKIIEPSGGNVAYTYGSYAYYAFSPGNYDGTNGGWVNLPLIATRTENSQRTSSDGAAVTGTWTYAITPPGSATSASAGATVTDPDGTVTDYLFGASGETSRKTYASSSRTTVLKEIASSYSQDTIPIPSWYETPAMISEYSATQHTTVDGVSSGYSGTSRNGGFVGAMPDCTVNVGLWTAACGISTGAYGSMTFGLENFSGTWDGSLNVLQQTTTDQMIDDTTAGSSYLAANLLSVPKSITVTDGTNSRVTTYTYDQSTYYSGSTLGHATTTSPSSGLNSHVHYDHSNNDRPDKVYDFNGNHTDFTYDSTGLYIASATRPDSEVDGYTYDVELGKVLTHTDSNSNVTTYVYDTAGRPWAVKNPDVTASGHYSQAACYLDKDTVKMVQAQATSLTLPTDSTTCPTTSGTVIAERDVDGHGRTLRTVSSSAAGDVAVDTTYDSMGRVHTVSSPYLDSGSASVWTINTSYDHLSRLLEMHEGSTSTTTPNGDVKSLAYSGLTTTVTDEASNKTKTITDFDGRITDVYEPTANNSTSSMLHTAYGYNVYGLTDVTQSGTGGETARTRSFVYDGLGRLLTAANPETGTITYTYPAYGGICAGDLSLPCTKTDANGITTSYAYDNVNRLTEKTYSDDATGERTKHYVYDYTAAWGGSPLPVYNQTGRVAMEYTGYATSGAHGALASFRLFSYDAMGRVILQEEMFPTEAVFTFHGMVFDHDFAGHLTDMVYPNGAEVKQSFDVGGRLSKVWTGTGASEVDYLASAAYHPNGAPSLYTYGNGVTESLSQNGRMQLSAITAANAASYTLMDRTYSFDPSDGLSSSCVYGSGNRNTGNIWKITDNLNSAWTRQFQYDCMDRLTAAKVGSTTTDYWLDSFGNMSPKVGGSPVSTFGASTNRVSNLPCYVSGSLTPFDAAGNQLCDTDAFGAHRIYTIGEDEQIDAITMSGSGSPYENYSYSPEGERVLKFDASSWTEYQWAGGQMVSEVISPGYWTNYIYADGKKIAKVEDPLKVVHLSGSVSSGSVSEGIDLTGLNGTTLATGDVLSLWQYTKTENSQEGGVWLGFVGGDTSTSGSHGGLYDQDGQFHNEDGITGSWHKRYINLSAWAGLTVNRFLLINERTGATGQYDIYYADVAMTRADGTVIPLWTGTPAVGSLTTNVFGPGSSTVAEDGSLPAGVDSSVVATRYYLDDHLGSAQYEMSSNGWPVWTGQFDAYGKELSTDYTSFNYKFTGYERDQESGLDYAKARYYGSGYGRFMSPDPIGVSPELENPQSWNKYSYTFNRPLTYVDPTGKWPTYIHEKIIDTIFSSILSASNVQILKDASAYVDKDQSSEGAYKHALRGCQISSCEEESVASSAGAQFVNQNISLAVDAQIKWEESPARHGSTDGYSPDALWYFGQALHTITDATSPWHDHYKKTWGGWKRPGDSVDHGLGEFLFAELHPIAEFEAQYEGQRLLDRYKAQLGVARKQRKNQQCNAMANPSC